MKKIVLMIILCAGLISEGIQAQKIYDFKVKTIEGENIKLSKYKGKVLLVVNVASKCGFTYQYEGLQNLFAKYESKGLVILGFPCNQFLNQEPGDEAEIANFCKLKYDVNFPMFSKIEVNGENADPLYTYLKTTMPGSNGKTDIGWNFTKFLLDRNGNPVSRFASKVKPEELESEILKLL